MSNHILIRTITKGGQYRPKEVARIDDHFFSYSKEEGFACITLQSDEGETFELKLGKDLLSSLLASLEK